MRAVEIVAALGGQWRDDHGVASCPVPGHGRGRGDLRPSLSITDGDDGRVLVHCHAGCDPNDVLHSLGQRGLWRRSADGEGKLGRGCAARSAHGHARPRTRANAAVERLWRSAWDEARPLSDTPGERYLREVRQVGLPAADVLRFHPRAPFSIDGHWRVAGLIAIIQAPSGAATGAQVTALKADGSGKMEHRKTRHTFGIIAGGAVRLAPTAVGDLTGALAVAEGIETALGFARLSGYPCWAALGGNLARFICPDSVEELVVAADHDSAGLKTARALAARESRERFVEIRHPGVFGEDWADVAARRWRDG